MRVEHDRKNPVNDTGEYNSSHPGMPPHSLGDYQQTKGIRPEKKIPTGKLHGLRKFDFIITEGRKPLCL
ncbi:hypothetical protein [Methanohalobium sp.]|uniref:hypothetical protein n=1 Tax=Methanohalobium sp. TaxID=2837493 RepID=UPI0025E6340E|nr:hypothetical protein [Methanohalobium sp.]